MKRCKKVVVILTLIFVVIFAGCSKDENEVAVYSFSGNNGHIQINNGVIVMSESETIFSGGNMNLWESDNSSIVSCSMTFYIMSGNEKKIVLSNSIEDLTGESIDCLDALGKISGDDVLAFIVSEDDVNWKENLYFEFTGKNVDGSEFVENVHLTVVDIVKSN